MGDRVVGVCVVCGFVDRFTNHGMLMHVLEGLRYFVPCVCLFIVFWLHVRV